MVLDFTRARQLLEFSVHGATRSWALADGDVHRFHY